MMLAERQLRGVTRFEPFAIEWRITEGTSYYGPTIDGRLLLYERPRVGYHLTVAEPLEEFRLVAPNGWEAVGRIELRTAPGEWPLLWGDFAYGFSGYQRVYHGDVCVQPLDPPMPVAAPSQTAEVEMLDIEPAELFRFAALRPHPRAPAAGAPYLQWAGAAASPLVQSLIAARAGQSPAAAMAQVAQGFVQGTSFIAQLGELGPPLQGLAGFVAGLGARAPAVGQADLTALAAQAGLDLAALQGPSVDSAEAQLWNSLLAALLAPASAFPVRGAARLDTLASLTDGLVALALAVRLAAADPTLDTPAGVREARAAIVALPATLVPVPPPPGQATVLLDPAAPVAAGVKS